jgi:uroporphyrinogen-III synthase
MTLWLTRPELANQSLAEALAVRGIMTITAPVQRILPIATRVSPGDFTAILTTSQHALGAVDYPESLTSLPLYTVGMASQAAARAKGFAKAKILAADAAGLAEALIAHAPAPQHFLYLRGRDLRLDIASLLRAAGHGATEYITYAAEIAPELPPEFLKDWPAVSGVVLYSARAAEFAHMLMDRHHLTPARPLDAFCLSDAIAASLTRERWGRVFFARHPSEESLLEIIISAKTTL